METLQDVIVNQEHIVVELTNPDAANLIESQLREACQACQRQGIFKMVIHVPQRPGPALTPLQVFRVATDLLQEWNRRIRVAVVVPYKPGPLEEFALLVARNRGINVNIYSDENEAFAWLSA